jgi:GPH family glycoside/pentoside/hexuronide:cation symporter
MQDTETEQQVEITKDGGRLSMRQLAIFSLPIIAYMAIELPWRIWLPPFFAQSIGIPLATVGTLIFAVRLFDMVADPLVGWLSDRFPTRYGMRKPWLVASIPITILGIWQVFFVAPGTSLGMLALWCIVLHAGYTLLITPHGGWGLEIGANYHERTRIMAAKVWFAALATPVIVLLPSILERQFAASRADQLAAMGYLAIGIVLVSVILVVRFIPEPAMQPNASKPDNPVRLLWRMARDRDMGLVLMLYGLAGFAEAASAATFIFLTEQGLGLTGWSGSLLLIQGLMAVGSIPLWAMASRRLGKRRALMAVLAWQGFSAPFVLLLPYGGLVFFAAYLMVRNVAWGADYMLLRSMVADVSAKDAARNVRRSGSYYALFNVTQKLAAALGAGGALWGLALFGFDANVAGADDGILVRIVYGAPPLFGAVIGIALLRRSRDVPPSIITASIR